MKFNLLPTEVKMKIFSYFTPQELSSTLAPVSKSWNHMAYDTTLWTYLLFINEPEYGDKMEESITAILNQYPHLRRLELLKFHDAKWISNIPNFINLRFLSLAVCCLRNKLPTLVLKCPHVQKVFFGSCCHFGGDVDVIKNWKYLQGISINNSLIDDVNKWIVDVAKKCQRLEEVHVLRYTNIGDSAFEGLTTEKGSNLKILSLNFDNLTTSSYKKLKFYHRLECLSIVKPGPISDSDFAEIQNLPKLRYRLLDHVLDKGNRLFSDNFQNAFKDVTISSLIKLKINNCPNVNDDMLGIFVNCCPNLKELIIAAMDKITDKGLEKLHGNQLERLEFSSLANISTDGVEDLKLSLPQLRELSVWNCPMAYENAVMDYKLKPISAILMKRVSSF